MAFDRCKPVCLAQTPELWKCSARKCSLHRRCSVYICTRQGSGWRNRMVPILSERSTKNSAFLDTEGKPQLRPLQLSAPHISFGMYLEAIQQASLLKPACFTSSFDAIAGRQFIA